VNAGFTDKLESANHKWFRNLAIARIVR